MIRVFQWDPSARAARSVPAEELPPTAADLPAGASVWIDLQDPTPEEEERVLGRFVPVHPLTREDISRPRRLPAEGAHLPKVEEFPGYLFVVANPLPWEVCDPNRAVCELPAAAPAAPPAEKKKARTRWARPQLSAVLTEHVLVTHHYDELPCVTAVHGQVGRRGETAGRGPDYLFHLVLDQMVDEYAPVVERMADRLDRVESRLFARPAKGVLAELLRLKRQVVFLRKTLTLEREVLARLVRGEFDLVTREELAYYRNVYDHLVRYTELVEGAREMVSDLMQTHLSAASNRLNEVMKVLTMISTTILPMTLVAGVYGMNFEHMPELKWEYGYPFALGLMLLTGLGGLAVFRWRRWI